MKITIDVLDKKSIQKGINDLKSYKRELREKTDTLCERLVERGAEVVNERYSGVQYWVSKSGAPDFTVTTTRKKKHFTIQATGEDVLFLEFGSGARYAEPGHPDNNDSEGFVTEGGGPPYGPSTYPDGKGHWDDPNGWYVYHNTKSWGNPATAGMYRAKEEMVEMIPRLKEEIFDG